MKKIIKILRNNFQKPRAFGINDIDLYLSGSKFTDGLAVNIGIKEKLISRQEKIVETVKDKNIIHVGCVDHLEIIDEKINNNEWLHDSLVKNTKKCIGIDINSNGIEELKKRGYSDVYYCDLLKPELDVIDNDKFDYMVLGEILEHVNNPQLFLATINERYKKNVSKILITVPNVYSYGNFFNAKRGLEVINSDHKTVFSPYTLIKILHLSNFRVEKISFSDPYFTIFQKIINLILRKKYFHKTGPLSSTLVIEASF